MQNPNRNPNFDPPAEVTSDNPSPGYTLISTWTRSGTTSGVNPSSLPFLSPQSLPADVTGYHQWSPNLVDWYAGNGVAGPNSGGPTVTITADTTGATTTVSATLSGSPARIFLRAGATRN